VSNGAPAFQFYPGDWLRDTELHMASAATKGIWIDLLCHMWFARERGTLRGTSEQLSQLAGCKLSEMDAFIAEAESLGFADIERDSHGVVTVRSRRMVRDEERRKTDAIRQQRHRSREDSGSVTPLSRQRRDPSSSSTPSLELSVGGYPESFRFPDSDSDPHRLSDIGNSNQVDEEVYPEAFERAWTALPQRAGNNPKARAYRAWCARIRERGATPEMILTGAQRYRRFCDLTGKTGTEHAMMAATFFGPDEPWKQEWVVPSPSSPRHQRETTMDMATRRLREAEREAANGKT
jgi:hypothetical protein